MLYVYGLDVRDFSDRKTEEHSLEEFGREDKYTKTYVSLLSWQRREQLHRLKQSKDQMRCIGAGILEWYGLKCLYQSLVPPKTAVGENGKPYFLEFPELQYNLSHAGDYVVAAFSDESVGIDIAERRGSKDSLIRRCLTEAEMGWLKGQVDRDEAFCRLWAGKESFVKWTGEGLRKDLRQVEITLDGAFCARDLKPAESVPGGIDSMEQAYLKEWREPCGYSVCVCCGDAKQLETVRGIHWVTARELESLVI